MSLCLRLTIEHVAMKDEISAAVTFLTHLVGKSASISEEQVEVFQRSLRNILTERFKDHWFPEKPCRGQAYRCIRVNETERRDPVLEQAAEMCGLRYENLKLPVELTIWVDPQEVCCRFGEHEGSYCTVASFKDNKENLTDHINLDEYCQKSSVSIQDPVESLKKQKSRRKVDRPKKPALPRNLNAPQNFLKMGPPKNPFINLKTGPQSNNPLNYMAWNPVMSPFNSRLIRPGPAWPTQENTTVRRFKKASRSSVYPHDRCMWPRK